MIRFCGNVLRTPTLPTGREYLAPEPSRGSCFFGFIFEKPRFKV